MMIDNKQKLLNFMLVQSFCIFFCDFVISLPQKRLLPSLVFSFTVPSLKYHDQVFQLFLHVLLLQLF